LAGLDADLEGQVGAMSMTERQGLGRAWIFLPIVHLFLSLVARPAYAGANPSFTLPLHAKVSQFEPCDGYLPVDCLDNRPTVDVAEGPVAVYLLVMNHCCLSLVQTAFDVDPEWTFSYGLWDCRFGLGPEIPPHPPFGPTSGTMIYAFNCVTTGELLPIGRMFFNAKGGCIEQVESSFLYGIHVMDCQQGIDRILPEEAERLGKICVGSGGYDACDRVTPVSPATWGAIKAAYF
jgi:hypothetical protein